MKIKLLRSLELIGVLLLLFGISLGWVGAEILNIPFHRMDLIPIAIGFCGVLIFFTCGSSIKYEKNKTKLQQIEEKDERLVTINLIAKSKSFNLISIMFPFCLLTLAMFGYMNKISFFVLAGLYLTSIIYYQYHLILNKEKM